MRTGTAAKDLYPSTQMNEQGWVEAFDRNPDMLWSIIGDIVKVVKASEGPRRTGRRPPVRDMSLEDVWALLYPKRYSLAPFPEALAELMAGKSQRQFARLVPCHQTTLSRLLSGHLQPDLLMLESLAQAGGVPPSYFTEWRARYIAEVVTQVLTERPNMGVTALKRMSMLNKGVA